MIIVSACLAGMATRYDGGRIQADLPFDSASAFIIPVCPEQLGGLPTPRAPACIADGSGEDVLAGNAKVMTKDGVDVTDNYLRGADEVARLAKRFNIRQAFMTERSPACGVTVIKDTDGNARKGCGVTVAALKAIGVTCVGITARKPED
ncbi:MAG: DUF523 domain-containing protein [Planctomycetota bacterium]|nr:MAG: DUF523 domain-containing protein [Planctomycetota bacterium]